jgi:UDP-N-acetylmuramate dehydrogenase
MSAVSHLELDVSERVPLGRHTSLRVGGPARRYFASTDLAALARVLDAAIQDQTEILILGGGSNLLISDEGFDGVVVRYTADGHRIDADHGCGLLARAVAGTNMSALARRLAHEGIGSLEWAASVPGTIGGAVVNNAGAFGGCVADHLVDAEVVGPDGKVRTLDAADLAYAYRTSVLKRGELGPVLVRSARLRVTREAPEVAMAKIVANQNQRTASQPRQLSAGSIFANPPGDYAGRLIEAVGLKGERRGGAEISAQHANFIVNTGSATATDVAGLMCLAQDAVWERFGVWLRTEVQLVGPWDPDLVTRLAGPPERVTS